MCFSIQKRETTMVALLIQASKHLLIYLRISQGVPERTMCYPTWSWSFVHATWHHSACRSTSIINQAWRACSVSTAHTPACCSAFSNNRRKVLVTHRASSCWAPLHATLSRATIARWNLSRSRVATHLSLSFAYLRHVPRPRLQFFQLKAKWN